MKFTDYATNKGCFLLKDDIFWLRGQLNVLPNAQIKKLLRDYIDMWVSGMECSESEIKAQNYGRNVANTYLRMILHEKRRC